MYRSSPFPSTLNTNVITALGMCEICTEAIHSVALWTPTLSQLWRWACEVCTEALHSVALNWNSNKDIITALGVCEVCSEAVHSVALWTWTFWFQHENGFAQQALIHSQKHENARIEHRARKRENAKSRKRGKCENVQSRKAVFAESKNTTANRTSNQRRTEMGKTRQDENAKTRKRQKILSLSGFLVFLFRWPHLAGQVAFFTFLEMFLVKKYAAKSLLRGAIIAGAGLK